MSNQRNPPQADGPPSRIRPIFNIALHHAIDDFLLMESELIGGYRVLKQIGAGGMAKVYLAVHKDVPNLKVILKVLSDSRLVERFRQEADKLAMLDGNPNICRIKHFFNHGESIVIAMEYIDGQSLDEIIQDRGKLSPGEAVPIMRHVLDVLEFAHAKGIYHRDIKPSNIMIDSQGIVKVIDFGIAKAKTDPQLTVTGSACGTPPYMAPEQFTPSEDTDYALVDVYAVGVTLYRMMSGELPFKGDNEFAIRDAKLFTDPKPLHDLEKSVPKDLSRSVMKALAKEPSERFSSVREMSETLSGVAPSQSEATITMPSGPKRSTKSRLPLFGGIAAGAVIVIAAVFFWPFQTPEPVQPVPPILISPAIEAELAPDRVNLVWHSVNIPNATYLVEYSSFADMSASDLLPSTSDTSLSLASELEEGECYWRVRAVSPSGDSSEYSTTSMFAVLPQVAGEPAGHLVITVDPYGDIYLDGELMQRGGSDYTATVDTGSHEVEVRNSDAQRKRLAETVSIVADSTSELSFAFSFPKHDTEPNPPPPTPATGELLIGSRPVNGASIYIDGERMDRPTPTTYPLSPGRHIIRGMIEINGVVRETADSAVTIVADSTIRHFLVFE